MRVHSISVERLFGRFDHTITLNREERITILHGPNGFGKTAILRLVHALATRDDTFLHKTPFSRLSIRFDEGLQLDVVREVSKSKRKHKITTSPEGLVAPWASGRRLIGWFQLPHSPSVRFSLLTAWDESAPSSRTERYVAAKPEGVRPLTYEALRKLQASETSVLDSPEADFFYFLSHAWSVHLISIQRLLVPHVSKVTRESMVDTWRAALASSGEPRTQSFQSAVEVYSNEFRDMLQAVQAEYAQKSQQLERTFPNRLLRASAVEVWSDEELQAQFAALEARRAELVALGLLAPADEAFQAPTETLDQGSRRVLYLYTKDNQAKLAVFDDLAARLALLTEIVNHRFQYKSLRVDAKRGFWFADREDGSELSPNVLSSGEQHQLVMLYELLFHLKEDSLVLLDEPELSLHVSWQVEFLRDMQRIIEVAKLDVLVATHSPQIIHDRWDLTVELQAPGPRDPDALDQARAQAPDDQ